MRRIRRAFTVQPACTSALIAEAFGVAAGWTDVVLDLELPEPLPPIVFVTGESGCGKTTLLRELAEGVGEAPLPDGPLHSWHSDEKRALHLLSLVGLGDARLFVARYKHLSDSQQARARLYALLCAGAGCVAIDEFLSTLDRHSARAVAFTTQKALRLLGVRAILCSAHDDIEPYLQPDLVIRGSAFPSRWTTKRRSSPIRNPFLDRLRFSWRDYAWYRDSPLSSLHYRGKKPGTPKDHLRAALDGREIGALVGSLRVYDGGRRISRVIVHPAYRGLGIGAALVRRYLRRFPRADTLAVMADFNPVFERAGMTRRRDVRSHSNIRPEQLPDFDPAYWSDRAYCRDWASKAEHRQALASQFRDSRCGQLRQNHVRESDRAALVARISNDPIYAGDQLWKIRPMRIPRFSA